MFVVVLNWPPTKEEIVQPGSVYSVPLTHAHSHIRLRPLVQDPNTKEKVEIEKYSRGPRPANFRHKPPDFQLCKQPLMWWRVQRTGEVAQELRTCYDKDKVYRSEF